MFSNPSISRKNLKCANMSNQWWSAIVLEHHQHNACQECTAIIIHIIDKMSMSASFSLLIVIHHSLVVIVSGVISTMAELTMKCLPMKYMFLWPIRMTFQTAWCNHTIPHPDIIWHTKDGLTIKASIEWRQGCVDFFIQKDYLQIVSDKIWPWLAPYYLWEKRCIKFGFGWYSCSRYETLLLLMMCSSVVLPMLKYHEMESFFGLRQNEICARVSEWWWMRCLHWLPSSYRPVSWWSDYISPQLLIINMAWLVITI